MLVAYFCDGNMFYIYVSKPHMSPVVKSCAKPFRRAAANDGSVCEHKPSHHFAG